MFRAPRSWHDRLRWSQHALIIAGQEAMLPKVDPDNTSFSFVLVIGTFCNIRMLVLQLKLPALILTLAKLLLTLSLQRWLPSWFDSKQAHELIHTHEKVPSELCALEMTYRRKELYNYTATSSLSVCHLSSFTNSARYDRIANCSTKLAAKKSSVQWHIF